MVRFGKLLKKCAAGAFTGFFFLLSACATSSSSAPTVGLEGLPAPDSTSFVQASDLRIGPLDVLELKVFGVEELTGSYQVNPDGQIKLPLVGLVEATGKTSFELASSVESVLGARFLRDPQVSVSISEAYGEKLTIEGAVAQPGMYPVRGPMTLLRSIAVAGGLTETADRNRVVIIRQIDGKRRAGAFDMEQIRSGKIPDPIVYGNDLVVVDGSEVKLTYLEVLRSLPLIGLFLF